MFAMSSMRDNPADAVNQILLTAFDVKPGRSILVGALNRRDQLTQTDARRRHSLGRDDHLVFLHVAADRRDLGDPGNRKKPRPDDPIGGGAKIDGRRLSLVRLMNMISPMIEDTGAKTGRSVSGGKLAPASCKFFVDDLTGLIDIGSPLKLDPDHRDSGRLSKT